MIYSYLLLAIQIMRLRALFDPCGGKSAVSGACDKDGDCIGFGVVCISGTCQCHYDYEQQTDPDSKAVSCNKLPDAIGSYCSATCKSPMFCQANKCACVRSKAEGNRCYSASTVGDTCTQPKDCSAPFTTCYGGRCACLPGTTQSGSSCSASFQCPTGAKAGKQCIRKGGNIQVVQNFPSSGGRIDNCSQNSYCYSPEGSYYGQCCPEVCPFSMTPVTSYSCDPTATSSRCPDNTHYCHRAAAQGYSSSVCCRLPCREPTPIFVKGQCYPKAFLGSSCQVNEQCDGGYGMQCSGGVCRCASGFVQYSDGYTTGENPPQTCVRDCSSRVAHQGECFSASSLASSCAVNEQCPTGAACFRGACFCDCRQGMIRSGSGCVKGQQTAKPGAPTTGSPLAGLLGGNKGGASIIDIFKGILPGGSG